MEPGSCPHGPTRQNPSLNPGWLQPHLTPRKGLYQQKTNLISQDTNLAHRKFKENILHKNLKQKKKKRKAKKESIQCWHCHRALQVLKITLYFPHKVSTHLHWYFPSHAYFYTCTPYLFQSTPQSTCCQSAPPDVSCRTQIMGKGGLKVRAATGCCWEMGITDCLQHLLVTRQSWLVCNQTEHSSRHFVFSGWKTLIPFTFSGKGLESGGPWRSSSP